MITTVARRAIRSRSMRVVRVPVAASRHLCSGRGISLGDGPGGKGCNCPRCQGALTKFWHQDAPVWGCVDCKEIYSNRDGSRVPRSWTTPLVSEPGPGAPPSVAAAAVGGGGESGRFAPGHLPPPDVIKAQLDRYVIGQDEVLDPCRITPPCGRTTP